VFNNFAHLENMHDVDGCASPLTPLLLAALNSGSALDLKRMTDWDGRGLVSTEWLAGHLGEPDLRIFDVTMHLRPTSEPGPSRLEDGRKGYEEAHIPGAVYLDLLRQFSDRAAPVPFTHLPADQLGRARLVDAEGSGVRKCRSA
jgi:hypothetical protein